MTVRLSALGTRAIVLDVEGTTTPVEFVYQVLFPFARARAAAYLERHDGSDECRQAVARLEEERAADAARGEAPPEATIDYVRWLMDRDRKSPGLKTLQ